MHVAPSYLLALLLATGVFGRPQAEAVLAYFATNLYDPCACSRLGEGLVDVAGPLRRALHAEEGGGCISPERQVKFLVRHWHDPYYDVCRRKFDAGDLSAFRRCWGWGRRE